MNNEIILAKIFLIFVFILFLFLFIYFIDVIKYIIFEVIFLLLFSILGLIFAFSSNDFISLFLSIELYGFSIYLAIALFRKSVFSLEAAFKYFIVGSFSSIILLVGIAIIYGLTGSFYFDDIAVLFYFLNIDSSANLFISKLALFIIIISLFIKIAVAPFHF
jgi:NADH-quinone oxidoreductase subunit N